MEGKVPVSPSAADGSPSPEHSHGSSVTAPSSLPAARSPGRRRRRSVDVTALVAGCSFLMDLASGILGLAVPLTAVYLGAPVITLGLLGAVQRIGYMLVGITAGTLSDRWGRKRLVVTSASLLVLLYTGMALTRSLIGFLAWVLLSGFTTGLFWSPMQAWTGDMAAGGNLNRSVSRFNVAWSAGYLVGMLVAGAVFSLDPSAPFWSAALACALILAIVVRLPAPTRQPATPSGAEQAKAGFARAETESEPAGEGAASPGHGEPPRSGFFRAAARVSVFAGFFLFATILNLFPKLGDAEGFSPFLIGVLLTSLAAARTLAFLWLGRWEGWQYREGLLVASVLLAGLCTAFIGWVSDPLTYLVALLLVGACQGFIYMSSLFYALNASVGRGRNSGWHEFSVNGGAMVGALSAGLVGELLGVRAPFLVGLLAAGAASACILLLRQFAGRRISPKASEKR